MHTQTNSHDYLDSQHEKAKWILLWSTTPVTLSQRLEHARRAMGWSQRQVGRVSGLKHESHYNVVLRNLDDGGGVRAETLDAIVRAFTSEGWSEDWIRRGVGAERTVSTVATPQKRILTPTPEPASVMRRQNHKPLIVPRLPNRERAITLLSLQGYDATTVDEELAMVAFAAELDPYEDRPVSWWIDGMRALRQRNPQRNQR